MIETNEKIKYLAPNRSTTVILWLLLKTGFTCNIHIKETHKKTSHE